MNIKWKEQPGPYWIPMIRVGKKWWAPATISRVGTNWVAEENGWVKIPFVFSPTFEDAKRTTLKEIRRELRRTARDCAKKLEAMR